MHRESLAPDAGMLFDFSPPREVGIWMKNTLIPLDILYIRANGSISRIVANAEPLSEDVRSSGGPVAGVLEIQGGRAAALGVKAGDHVRHAWFDTGR